MRNRLLDNLDNIVEIKVEGKNINNYINKLIKKRIHILKITPISYKEAHLILKYSEYLKIKKIKTILYQVTIISYKGRIKIKRAIKKNRVLLFFTLLGLTILILCSRLILSIEIIHQDKEIRNLLKEELKRNGIKKYQWKKNYNELEKIEDKILENNKDRLEWIEIINLGTKYTVRVEERKITKKKEEKQYQNIISKKEAVIVEINAIRGEKLKRVNDYVKKGDIIIAGYITLPNTEKIPTIAEGMVLGEVWYKVKLDYPFIYQEKKLTGRKKQTYSIVVLNKKITPFSNYKTYISKDKILLKTNLLEIKLIKEKQYETKVLDEVYTEDIAKNKAINYVKEKMMKNNSNIKEVKEAKILSSSSDEDSINLTLFIKTIEDIAEERKIEENLWNKEDMK